MITVTVRCDWCNNDVTYTSNSVDYRIYIGSERIVQDPESTVVTDMHIRDPLPQNKHFCGTSCLRRWVASNALREDFIYRWKRFAP